MARAPYTYRKRNAETWRPQRVVSKALAGYKAQTTSYITLPGTGSGNLFLGLKINKYWKPTKWRAAFPPNRGLTWQAVILRVHIYWSKFLRLILLPSLWLPFATVRRKKNWAWVEWPPFGNKGLHFLPGHSWKLQFDQSAETLTCCVSGPDKGATNLDVWWSVLPFSVTAAAVGSPLAPKESQPLQSWQKIKNKPSYFQVNHSLISFRGPCWNPKSQTC